MAPVESVPKPHHAGLLLEKREATAFLTLDRPERRNSLSLAVLQALAESLDSVASDRSVRAVVLASRGPVFSSGHDLREVEGASGEEVEATFAKCAEVMRRLHELPQPVVARVQGLATAAGCQLVAACDLAVAAESARFATPGVKIGLFCSTPAVPLVRAVGRKRALEMLFRGEPIDAQTALAWGLVNRVVPERELDRAVEELLEPILAASAHTLALGKRSFYEQIELAESAAYAAASSTMCANAADADAREGMRAFLEKRRPEWRHT